MNKNFTFYKIQDRSFCIKGDKNKENFDNEKYKKFSDELDNLNEFKQITLSSYLAENEVMKQEENNLTCKTKTNGNSEVEIFVPDKNISKIENFKNYREFLERKERYEKDYTIHKIKIGMAIFVFFIGLFTLWIPLYKYI